MAAQNSRIYCFYFLVAVLLARMLVNSSKEERHRYERLTDEEKFQEWLDSFI
jgi:hypothetical protein